ncbi:MAG: NAD(P)H-hydrate epimerase, partial [Candidatus Izemoplasmataceae bacterium]
MEEIVELKTMKAIESYTQKKKRISEVTLIDHVAKALFDKIKDHVHKEATGVCFSGLGNNGADASKLTDYLVASGYNIKLVIVGNQTALSASHASILSQIKCAYYWSLDTFLPQEMIDLINRADYVIDGLFGTGLNKSIKGIYKTLIDTINQKNKTVYSIDIPSGLNAHNGIVKELAIKASITFGVGFAKFGYYLNDGLDYVGKLIMVDVGMVSTLEHKKYQVIEQKIPKDYLDRNHNSHKYHYGNLALFGGSHGLMGALHLSALSAYKLGAGLVHTYT